MRAEKRMEEEGGEDIGGEWRGRKKRVVRREEESKADAESGEG